MTWSLERWQTSFHRSVNVFLFISTIGLVTNLLICTFCLIYLCVKRTSRNVPSFAFWQIGLALANEVAFGVQAVIMLLSKDNIEFTDLWFQITQNLIILSLIMS